MALEEGQPTSVPLACGCSSTIITLIPGTLRIQCPQCERTSRIVIKVNPHGDISLDTYLD